MVFRTSELPRSSRRAAKRRVAGAVAETKTPSSSPARIFAPGASETRLAHAARASSSDAASTSTRAFRMRSSAPAPTKIKVTRLEASIEESNGATTIAPPPQSSSYFPPRAPSATTRRVGCSSSVSPGGQKKGSPGTRRRSSGRTSSGDSPPPPAREGTKTRPTSSRNVGSTSSVNRCIVAAARVHSAPAA